MRHHRRVLQRIVVMLLFVLLFLFPCVLHSQVVAGIMANGKIINHGDTLRICKGNTITYESAASGSLTIQWRFKSGLPGSATGAFPLNITYNTTGYDTTFQRVDGSAGFSDSTFIIVQVSDVYPIANYNFVPDNVCGNIPIQFSNTSGGNGALSYSWDFNDGIRSTDIDPTHQFLTAIGLTGTQQFQVKLVVTNSVGCKDSVIKPVTIQKVPDASFGNADAQVNFGIFNGIPTFKHCASELFYPFQFTNSSTTISIHTSYKIKWGDGSADSTFTNWPTGSIITHVFPRGSSDMTVEVTGNTGCIGIKKYNIFLGTTPSGGLGSQGNEDICSSQPLSFNVNDVANNPPGTQYIFYVNDGTPSQTFQHPPPAVVTHFFGSGSCGISSSNGSVTYDNAYAAYLTITNPCGSKSPAVVPIYVSGKPKASISLPSPVVCINSNVPIVSTSTFGNVVSSTGTFTSSCSNVGKMVWEISPATGYTLTAGTLGSYNGDPFNGLVWTNGSSTLNVNFTTPGTYTIKLSVSNERCGYVTTTRTICARLPPQASFTMDQHKSCGPSTVSLTNTSPPGGCEGDSYFWDVTYADPQNCAAGSGIGYAFANGSNASSASPSIAFNMGGRYVIHLTTTAINAFNYCQRSDAYDTFYVVGPPVASIAPIPGICINNTISPSATANNCYALGPVSYQWNFAGGSPASSTNLSPGAISYAATGGHQLTFIVKDEGCNLSDTATFLVNVADKPVAEAGNVQDVCSGATVSIGMMPVTGVIYQWSPATGLSDPSIANPVMSLIYNGPSNDTTYKIFLTASRGSDCSSVDSVEIKVRKKPALMVNPVGADLCLGDSVQLAVTGAATYLWTPAASLNFADHDIVMARPGSTTAYTVTGTAANGCTDSREITVTVRSRPLANAGNDTAICSGTALNLGTTAAPGITYLWMPAQGLSSVSVADPVATIVYTGPSDDSTFTFYLTASLGSFCSSNDSVKIKVRQKPVLTVDPISGTICYGDSQQLTAAGAFTYVWMPTGSLDTAAGDTVLASPAITTMYTVIGALENGCTDSKNITVTVNPHAKAAFTGSPTILCAPVDLQTVITTTPYPLQNSRYNWYADNILIGSNTSGVFPSFVMNMPGDSVEIKLVAESATGCNWDSVVLLFVTRPSVIPSFIKDKDSECAPLIVNFTNTTVPYINTQYQWNFGNGVTSTLYDPPAIRFDASPEYRDTVYYITLTANNGCVSIVKKDSVKVFAHSQARFNVDHPEGCSPFPVVFTNTSRGNNTSYYWDFGDGIKDTTHTTGTLPHTYITGSITTYRVQLISENRCERDTQAINILVSPNTIQAFLQANGNQLSGCAPHTVTFNNTSVGAALLTWDFGDGSPLVSTPNDQIAVSHTYQSPGDFIISIRLRNNCSDTLIKRNVSVFSKPVAAFTIDNPVVCPGSMVSFINTSQNADGYQWFWGDGGNGTIQNGQHSYNGPGEFQVSLLASKLHPSGFVCTDTALKTVSVRSKIIANINAPNNRPCAPYTYTATAGNASGALKVEWFIASVANPQAQSYYIGQNMTHNFLVAGNYTIKLVVQTAADCKDSTTSSLTVYNTPDVSFGPLNVMTCNHDTAVLFTAIPTYPDNDPLQYKWFFNGMQEGVGNPYTHQFTVTPTRPDAANYIVTALAQNAQGCGDTSLPGRVIINPLPFPTIEVNPAYILQQPDYTFSFRDLALTDVNKVYTWDMGDRTLQRLNGQEISYQYGDTGSYKVSLLVVNYQTGCRARDSVNVRILYVPGYLQVPNAMCMGCSNNALKRFLPMGKGLKEYKLSIFTTWGQKIFESTHLNANGSPDEAWDGTANGKILQQDAYTWQIEARYINDTEWKGMIYPGVNKPVKSGFITIIK